MGKISHFNQPSFGNRGDSFDELYLMRYKTYSLSLTAWMYTRKQSLLKIYRISALFEPELFQKEF